MRFSPGLRALALALSACLAAQPALAAIPRVVLPSARAHAGAPVSMAAPAAAAFHSQPLAASALRASASAAAARAAPAPAAPLAAAAESAQSAPAAESAVAGESSRDSAEHTFAQAYGETLIEGRGDIESPAAAVSVTEKASARPLPARAPAAATAARTVPAPAASAGFNPGRAIAPAAAALSLAFLAASPWLVPYAALVGSAGSLILGAIGVPQIVSNAIKKKEGVKDAVIATPLIWFAAATLLTATSLATTGLLNPWNLVNAAGVLSSAIVVGQILHYRRDSADLRAAWLTAAAVGLPMGLMAAGLLLPAAAWASASFTAAMGLLWVLNWPQVRRNYDIYMREGRVSGGQDAGWPALVASGSLLHLFAALVAGNLFWAINAAVAMLTSGMVLAQLFAPGPANRPIGRLAELQDRLVAALPRPPASPARVVDEAFGKEDLSAFAGKDADATLAELTARVKALGGRGVLFLQGPSASGKSTLVKTLEGALPGRLRVLEIDRYFKQLREIPKDASGKPDYDRPDALYLDRAAAHMRTLLAGGTIELPERDWPAAATRFKTGNFMTLGPDDILVVDSIFAAHPTLRAAAEGRPSLVAAVDAPAIARLARRLRRDKAARGRSLGDNLSGWELILDNEREHMLPLSRAAELRVNLVSEKELAGLRAAYAGLLAEEGLLSRRRVARLMSANIRASLAASHEHVPALDRAAIQAALSRPDFQPRELIEALKKDPFLAAQYAKDSGVREKYSLERHTLMMMGQFERYHASRVPAGSLPFFRLMLALHDIGKPRAVEAGEKDRQHEFTRVIMRDYLHALGWKRRNVDLAVAIVDGDPIGRYVQGGSRRAAKAELEEMAGRVGLHAAQLYPWVMRLYLSDAPAYTADAGGLASLDRLFRFDREKGEVLFTPRLERRIERLRRSLDR